MPRSVIGLDSEANNPESMEPKTFTTPGPVLQAAIQSASPARVAATVALMQPRIFCSLVAISKSMPQTDRLRDSISVQHDADRESRILASYDAMYTLFYNPFLKNSLDISYLGYALEDTDLPSFDSYETDFVVVKNEALALSSLHVHVALPEVEFNVAGKEDPVLVDVAELLWRVYRFADSDTESGSNLDSLGTALINSQPRRDHTLSLSRYTYVSLAGLSSYDLDRSHKRQIAENVYRVLYQHPRGVNPGVAKEVVNRDTWTSTSFFRLFYQPGGVATLSTGYPQPDYGEHSEYFLPPFGGTTSPWPQELCPSASSAYDYVPDYPPLRYLALPAVEYVGWVEEEVRGIFEKLMSDSIATRIRRWVGLHSLEKRYFRALNLEHLRLPVTREFIDELIANKVQKNAIEAIKGLKASLMNTLLMILAVAATVIAVVQLAAGD